MYHNLEDVKKIFKEHGLELLENEYINNHTKMKAKIIDTEYLTTVELANLLSGQKWYIVHKSNPYSMYNIKIYLQNNNIPLEILTDEYINNSTKFKVKCACGKTYETTWASICNKKKYCCNECSNKKRKEKQKIANEKIFELFNNHNLTILDISQYKNNLSNLSVVDKLGYKGKISYGNLSQNKQFYKFSIKYNEENFLYNLNVFAKNQNFNCKVLDYNVIDKDNIVLTIECACGNVFKTKLYSFLSNNKYRCDICTKKESSYENMTESFLLDNNIKYKRQYKFEDCKYKRSLPFDFYLTDYNILIEVDGQLHYHISNYNNTTKNKAEQRYSDIKRNDNIKTEYCKKNNIKLIRIPFWYFYNNRYKKFLLKEIR